MRKRTIIILAFTLIIAILISGCGKKDDPKVGNETTLTEEVENIKTGVDELGNEVAASDYFIQVNEGGTCMIKRCNCTDEDLVIPASIEGHAVVSIGGYSFSGCPAKTITIPDSVTSIGSYAFNGCDNLETVNFSKNLKTIGYYAFNICPRLRELSFPDGMEEFQDMPFSICESLTEVYIPASVTSIEKGITYAEYCPNLIIITPSGSVAEAKANEYGIPVINDNRDS